MVFRNLRRYFFVRKGALISETAEIGIVDFAGNKKNLKIGDFSSIGRVHIALHDTVIIGNKVCINDGVKILTASHDVNCSKWTQNSKPIIINDFAWIATDAIILPGVTIGKGAVIGAGAVVRKDVDDFNIVVGNPAFSISKKRTKALDYNPCEFLASNSAWLR
jgi:maltose O-acetyltransferase